jgi:hypothetical protein
MILEHTKTQQKHLNILYNINLDIFFALRYNNTKQTYMIKRRDNYEAKAYYSNSTGSSNSV